MVHGILAKSSEKPRPQPQRDLRDSPKALSAATNILARGSISNSSSSVPQQRAPSSPLQTSYSEFLQQRRVSMENSKNRRRASSSPTSRRSHSRCLSPSAAKHKPSYMSQTHSSKKKSGSPPPDLRARHGLQSILGPDVVQSWIRSAHMGYYTSANGAERSGSRERSTLPPERSGRSDYDSGYHASSSRRDRDHSLTPEAPSAAMSESMLVQDVSMGGMSVAFRAGEHSLSHSLSHASPQANSGQRGRRSARTAPASGQSKARRSSAGAKPVMDKAQARLLFDDLSTGAGEWTGSLRSGVTKLPSGKKPLRI